MTLVWQCLKSITIQAFYSFACADHHDNLERRQGVSASTILE